MSYRPWGCPKCEGHESFVDETATDEDGYVVRLRKCLRSGCDGTWATEEVPIYRKSFWQRAHSRNVARAARNKGHLRRCAKCHGAYESGRYQHHVAHSKLHAAALLPPSNGSSRSHVRAYAREYARKRRDVA